MLTSKEKSKICRALNAMFINNFEDYLISREGKLYYLDLETETVNDISGNIYDYTKEGVPIYRIIDLKNKEKYLELPLDKLVLNTFVGDLEGKILHKDFDYTNCNIDNIRYELDITKLDNIYMFINNKKFKLFDTVSTTKYYVSEDGVVYSTHKNYLMRKSFTTELYTHTHLDKNRSLHRVVYTTWVTNDMEDYSVNHIDGNKFNNHYSNLELMTSSENVRHAHNNGLRKDAKLTEDEVHSLCRLIESGTSFNGICEYFKANTKDDIRKLSGSISDIRRGKIWKDISCNYDLFRAYKGKLKPDKVHQICQLLDDKYYIHEISTRVNVPVHIIGNIKKGLYYSKISSSYNFMKKQELSLAA